jgi:hypothetical protein
MGGDHAITAAREGREEVECAAALKHSITVYYVDSKKIAMKNMLVKLFLNLTRFIENINNVHILNKFTL